MKPQHLRNSLGLGANIPIRFAVVFANSRNRLDRRLPENMLTISTSPTWLNGVAKAGIGQINVAEMARRIQARLDYSEQSYERFRMATDSGWSYSTMVTRRNAANNAAIAGPAVPPASVTGNNRPGMVPRWMFYTSLGVMVIAILLNDTGAIGARAADALMGPVQVAFDRIPFMEANSVPAFAARQQKFAPSASMHGPDQHRAAHRPKGHS